MSYSYRALASIPITPTSAPSWKDYIEKQCIHLDLILNAIHAAIPRSRVKHSPYVDKNGKQRVNFTISSGRNVYYMNPLGCAHQETGEMYVNEKSFDWFLNNVMEKINGSSAIAANTVNAADHY